MLKALYCFFFFQITFKKYCYFTFLWGYEGPWKVMICTHRTIHSPMNRVLLLQQNKQSRLKPTMYIVQEMRSYYFTTYVSSWTKMLDMDNFSPVQQHKAIVFTYPGFLFWALTTHSLSMFISLSWVSEVPISQNWKQ